MSNGTTDSGRGASPRGIPTTYRGITYRSRVEARWAAFFDVVRWKHDYEPIDLDGYIPDFILPFKDGPVLVEVKSHGYVDRLEEYTAKIERSGWKGEAIIVGQSPTLTGSTNAWNDCHHGGSPLGLLGEYYPDVDQFCWGAASAIECTECMSLGFCHAYQSFRNRVCGHYDGDHYLGEWSDELRDALWATAVNATQWNP